MQITYIDGYGQQQVALLEQVMELVRYGYIHQQTQYFDASTQQWQFFGSMFPQLFQHFTAPPATQVVAEVETEPLIQLQTSQHTLIATNPVNPMATAPLIQPGTNIGLPQASQQPAAPAAQVSLSAANSSTIQQASQFHPSPVASSHQRTLATGPSSSPTLMGQPQASTLGKQSIPFPSPSSNFANQNKVSLNSSAEGGYPTWLLVTLLVASLSTMALGQFGAGYWITLLVAISGIILFSRLSMGTGLQMTVTTLLTLLAWAVPLVGTVSDAAEESRSKVAENER